MNRETQRRAWMAFVLLSILISISYAGSFKASWHFDDFPNIVNNSHLHLNDLQPASLIKTLFSNPSNPYQRGEKLYRPLPSISFALNWYLGKDNVYGYHLVNTAIHVLTAFILFLTIAALLGTPNLKKRYAGKAYFTALLAAGLWALNPIQTQAVTYIVQRMASMAAMFYILGIYLYVRARLSQGWHEKAIAFALCLVSFLLALGSKQNTVVMPLTLVLTEFTFFRDLSQKRNRLLLIGICMGAGLICAVAGLFSAFQGDPGALLKGYDYRPFTLTERLLTQPRILIHYLSQIFYPLPYRLSIEHDVILSTGVFKPWTTPAAILAVLLSIVGGILSLRKYPLFGYAVLFFFLNHLVESSILPLEMVFEHRNYLPSLFLFLPPAVGCQWLIDRYGRQSRPMAIILLGFVTCVIIAMGLGTHIRNRVWATEKSLWEDAALKAPGRGRPLAILAWDMAYGAHASPRNYANALVLFKRAMGKNHTRLGWEPGLLDNMAGIHLRQNQAERAIALLEQAIHLNPHYAKGRFNLAAMYMTAGQLERAAKTLNPLLDEGKAHEGYLNSMGLILLRQKRPQDALAFFRRALRFAPRFPSTLLYTGKAFSDMGHYRKAEWFLQRAAQSASADPLPLFCLMENSLRAENRDRAGLYADMVLKRHGLDGVEAILYNRTRDKHPLSIDTTRIAQLLSQHLQSTSARLINRQAKGE